jgi:hypothetical protein
MVALNGRRGYRESILVVLDVLKKLRWSADVDKPVLARLLALKETSVGLYVSHLVVIYNEDRNEGIQSQLYFSVL